MGRGHLGCERAVGGGQSRYRGMIADSGHGKTDDCVGCFLLIGVVDGLETSVGSGDPSVMPFEVGCCELHIEVLPGLVGRKLPLPGIIFVKE